MAKAMLIAINLPTDAATWAQIGVGLMLLSLGLWQVYQEWKERRSKREEATRE